MSPPEIVVLGGPNSGKTHFAGQLYGRLQRRPEALRLRQDAGTPPDLHVLEEVLRCLESGRAAAHTASATWDTVSLPLVDTQERPMDLRWPDYGGEQINAVTKDRLVSEHWRERLVAASGWLLFIRLRNEITYPDRLATLTDGPPETADPETRKDWDANAKLVELLQILLHVGEIGTVKRITAPRLAVLLSCYDEQGGGLQPPREALRARLPLLSSFIESNWRAESLSIWGLSSLGRLLKEDSSDDAFIDSGPEFQGWIVPPEGGKRDPDLTAPLAWILEGA